MNAIGYALPVETAIANRLVDHGLSKGYAISVFDGGEWVVKYSDDPAAICAALASTDSDTVTFSVREPSAEFGRYTLIASFVLIWGNECDLISCGTGSNVVWLPACEAAQQAGLAGYDAQ